MHHRPQGTVFRQKILTVAPTMLSCGHPHTHRLGKTDFTNTLVVDVAGWLN